MLKGISPLISPELLKVLAEMGHGDELILGDAHFPGNTYNQNVIRAEVEGDELDISVEQRYIKAINKSTQNAPKITRIGRFEFYDRAKKAFSVVMTGECAKYGNLIIKKGVTPVE